MSREHKFELTFLPLSLCRFSLAHHTQIRTYISDGYCTLRASLEEGNAHGDHKLVVLSYEVLGCTCMCLCVANTITINGLTNAARSLLPCRTTPLHAPARRSGAWTPTSPPWMTASTRRSRSSASKVRPRANSYMYEVDWGVHTRVYRFHAYPTTPRHTAGRYPSR